MNWHTLLLGFFFLSSVNGISSSGDSLHVKHPKMFKQTVWKSDTAFIRLTNAIAAIEQQISREYISPETLIWKKISRWRERFWYRKGQVLKMELRLNPYRLEILNSFYVISPQYSVICQKKYSDSTCFELLELHYFILRHGKTIHALTKVAHPKLFFFKKESHTPYFRQKGNDLYKRFRSQYEIHSKGILRFQN